MVLPGKPNYRFSSKISWFMVYSMAFESFVQKGILAEMFDMEDILLNTKWEDVTCPICLDFPHNGVLLQCSSYEKGCRPFVCDTDHLHSNCLDRFKSAYGMASPSTSDNPTSTNSQSKPVDDDYKLVCPLCRGEVTGWVVVDKARLYLDQKKRCCEEERCTFSGTYLELRKHAQLEHPHSRPSKIDPARQLDWENFQQSSEIIDVLSTIHSEVPRGVVLGDYVFDNFRNSRNRRRSRVADTRRGSRRSSFDTSNSDEGSVASVDFTEYRVDEMDDEFANPVPPSRGSSGHRSHSLTFGCSLKD
ncbi:hypothetical protein Tsubulata_026885 [Turnera subulata]|uniref:DUF1644 domain-containing protein n=1 Tax=Turnera subulata TaxID=218843 RepID=A0A9Q0FN14_9ROSI|nr:hypothetical protein Tsubulata_026885 [Turnera subulata]